MAYDVTSIAFSPDILDGGATNINEFSNLGDDDVSDPITLPFSFVMYSTSYDTLYVGSNGLMGFINSNLYNYSPQLLPDDPNNGNTAGDAVFAFWTDLSPGNGGEIKYETFGSVGSRRFVVNYYQVPQYNDNSILITTQVKFFEGTNVIEIHTTHADSTDNDTYPDPGAVTQGIQNSDGTQAAWYDSRNLAINLVLNNDAVRFTFSNIRSDSLTVAENVDITLNATRSLSLSDSIMCVENTTPSPLIRFVSVSDSLTNTDFAARELPTATLYPNIGISFDSSDVAQGVNTPYTNGGNIMFGVVVGNIHSVPAAFTYDGVPLTLLVSKQDALGFWIHILYLLSPSIGTHTFSTITNQFSVVILTYKNARQDASLLQAVASSVGSNVSVPSLSNTLTFPANEPGCWGIFATNNNPDPGNTVVTFLPAITIRQFAAVGDTDGPVPVGIYDEVTSAVRVFSLKTLSSALVLFPPIIGGSIISDSAGVVIDGDTPDTDNLTSSGFTPSGYNGIWTRAGTFNEVEYYTLGTHYMYQASAAVYFVIADTLGNAFVAFQPDFYLPGTSPLGQWTNYVTQPTYKGGYVSYALEGLSLNVPGYVYNVSVSDSLTTSDVITLIKVRRTPISTDRYWVGDSGNWSDGYNHWSDVSGGQPSVEPPDGFFRSPISGGSIANNDVYFDANSFSANGMAVNLDVDSGCRKFTMTGLTKSFTLSGVGMVTAQRDVVLNSLFTATNTGGWLCQYGFGFTFTQNGANLDSITSISLSSNGDESNDPVWNLGSDLVVPSADFVNRVGISGATFGTSNGTFNTNNYTVTAKTLTSVGGKGFGSNANSTFNAGTSTLNIGGFLVGGSATFGWNATFNGSSSTINFTPYGIPSLPVTGSPGNAINTIHSGVGGSVSFGTINIFKGTGATAFGGFDALSWNLSGDLTIQAGSTVYMTSAGASVNVTGTFTANGTPTDHIIIDGNAATYPTPSGQGHLSAATAHVSYINVANSFADGAGIPFLDDPGGVNNGNNTNWLFTLYPNVFDTLTITESIPGKGIAAYTTSVNDVLAVHERLVTPFTHRFSDTEQGRGHGIAGSGIVSTPTNGYSL